MSEPQAFSELMAGGPPPLDRALAAIAAFDRPDVVSDRLLDQLDVIASELDGSGVADLCSRLFATPGGFAGNRTDYYDPANSLLDMVLRRRLGIPITLSVIGIEVGRRLGASLVGIGMPGHFLLRDATDPTAFFDPFDDGRPLDVDGCRDRFEQLHRGALTFDHAHLSPTPPAMIVLRVLNNLHAAYLRSGDRAGVLRTLSLQSAVPGAPVTIRRELGERLAASGRFDDAAHVYERLALEDPAGSEDHRRAALRLRARLN